MNLAEVLNVALPELPAKRIGKTFPRLHPKMIAREQIENGIPTVVAMVSGGSHILRFSREQWQLVQLFDGVRSYHEIAEVFQQQTGAEFGEEQVREFAESLQEANVWYKTSLENVTATDKVAEQRQRRKNKKKIDLSFMSLSAWDPDAYLTKLNEILAFGYTKWFAFVTLGMFTIMALIFVSGWSEIWRDTMQYYSFTDKGAADLAEFWLLFCGLGFFHESAHGLTCKHYGGGVHQMGFMLIYLSPAFCVDVSEVYVYGAKWQRIATILAGIWIELMFCSVASIVWWGTPAGSGVHDFAYKVMMITGVAVVLMNLNPLIKLDGYYLFGEMVGVPSMKESSTEYLSSWVKRNVFRLPMDVLYLRPARRWLFVGYALISGLYSYALLYTVVRFSYNVSARFNPDWAFIPSLALAFLIFRARLRSAVRFVKDFYLDKRQSLFGWWTGSRKVLISAAALVALFAPVWRETVTGRFILEPQQRASIRAAVPGQIAEVLADEGTHVAAGAPLLILRNSELEADADEARASLRTAEANAREAEMRYANLGVARAERASQAGRSRSVFQQISALQVASPISGIVATPRLRDRVGSFVQAGDLLGEVDGATTLRARIFIPEFQVQRLKVGFPVSLKLESVFWPIRGAVASIAPAASEPAAGLSQEDKYKGIAPPAYYAATVLISNPGETMRPGMSGDAKIRVAQQSLAGLIWRNVREFVQRKLW
ncbi:MAG: HlyD family efflux transporter periplasmic adaptor subunit [Candidatus Sulfotelmatobacter sp.]|jgi:putative peptide zinc metalloprotease protein